MIPKSPSLSARALARHYRSLARETTVCLLCGSDPAFHRTVLTDDVFSMRLRTAICTRCGLVMTNPRLRPADYQRFYASDYQVLYNDVSAPDAEYVRRRGFEEAARFRVHYYQPFLHDRMTLLDVGSGTGAFLAALRREYPSAVLQGLEPSGPFAAYARRTTGVPVVEKSVDHTVLTGLRAEVVSLFHVLEHLLDPLGTLRRLDRCLKSSGRLLIEVPNVMGSWRGIGMFHIAHTCAFSPRTLGRMVRCAGFRVECCDDREYPGLESSVFMVAQRESSAHIGTPMETANSGEIEATVSWITSRVRGARLARFRKAVLLDLRTLRRALRPLVRGRGHVEGYQ